MNPLSRRMIVAAAGAFGAARAATAAPRGFGNPDQPAEGRINGAVPSALTNPGPQNATLTGQFPSFNAAPPPTDINGMALFWSSFNNAHTRFQSGGWAREVNQRDFQISTELAGVNMRLAAGGIREMHWHQQAEWAFVTNGTCRITVLDSDGRPQVADVHAGGLWYFPPGLPHSLQGLGPDGTEFLIVFDDGHATEFDTLMVTDWLAHTPPEVLAKNFGVSADAFRNVPLNNLWIFQGDVPGSLAADQSAVGGGFSGAPKQSFVFDAAAMPATKTTAGGSVRIVDSVRNFHASVTVAMAQVVVKPGALRELHWHPNADEWQYWISGQGRMTVFNAGPAAQTADFKPGDVGYVKKSLGHYIENTGNDDLVFLEIFKTAKYEEISLTDWLVRTPPAMVAQTLRIDPKILDHLPRSPADVVPS